jgi:DNA-binding transcriptional MerR regulator
MVSVKTLPGTTIVTDVVNRKKAEEVFSHIFAGGNIYSSQVTAITGIEQHSVQNWVARGFVSRPINKQYSKRQLCRLIIINMLGTVFKIGDITEMLSSVNGNLSDENDDLIPDDILYICFCELCGLNEGECIAERVESTSLSVTEELASLTPDNRKKVAGILRTMFYAYRSAEMNKIAHDMFYSIMKNINKEEKAKGEIK